MKFFSLAGCIIVDRSSRILLLHRNTEQRQQWEIPGGKVEAGEEAHITAVREVREELGVDVVIRRLLGKKNFSENKITYVYSWYLARITSGIPMVMEAETFDDLRYFSLEDLKQIHEALSPNTQNFLASIKDRSVSLSV